MDRNFLSLDLAQAWSWGMEAASAGHADAQSSLSAHYSALIRDGVATASDRREHIRWLRASAAQSLPLALHNLASRCLVGVQFGDEVLLPVDREYAIELWRRAAAAGFREAISKLTELLF